MDKKIRIGLLRDVPELGVAKYSGVLLLMQAMKKDGRFDPYVVSEYDDGTFEDFKLISPTDIYTDLDYLIRIHPYSNNHRFFHYHDYIQKMPYIYCEYGIDSILEDPLLLNEFGAVSKNAEILLCSTKHKKDILISSGVKGEVIDKMPQFDYPNLYKKQDLGYKKVVIYAPHHSVKKDRGCNNNLRYSTFNSFKDEFLELVKQRPDWLFYYKPHPNLSYTIKNHNEYANQLKEYNNVKYIPCNSHQTYYQLFVNSDILITDCISFIGEWLPNKKPLIRLRDATTDQLSPRAENIIEDCFTNFDVDKNSLDDLVNLIENPKIDLNAIDSYLEELIVPEGNCKYILDKIYDILTEKEMQALMLAAGMGSRLGKFTQNNTKCMVEVANKKLIDRAIDAIEYANKEICHSDKAIKVKT